MKIILSLIVLLSSMQLHAQDDRVDDRTDDILPVITKKIATLKQATGWIKNDIGKWVSAKNGILSDLHEFPQKEEDFTELNIYRVNINNKEYSMLVKTTSLFFSHYIFDTATNKTFTTDSSYYVTKSLVGYGEHFLSGKLDEKKLIANIKSDLKELGNTMQTQYVLNVSTKWFPAKKIYRFYFDEEYGSRTKDLKKERLIEKYYETTDTLFMKFIQEL